jgi:hypothetical protein
MLSKKLLQDYFFSKTTLMSGLFGIVLTCATINVAEATACYCGMEAYSRAYIINQAKYWGDVSNDARTCNGCRKLCQEGWKAGFAYGNCWGQTIKSSNCKGCESTKSSKASR